MLLDSDAMRLQHMLEAAQGAVGYIAGNLRGDLDGNRPLQHSLVCLTFGSDPSLVSQSLAFDHCLRKGQSHASY